MPRAPITKYDDLDFYTLRKELDKERRHRDSIVRSNMEMEKSNRELEVHLMELEKNSRKADDNEWRVRFESQTALNKQFQEHKSFLEKELTDMRRKLNTGSYPDAMGLHLDSLSESELIRVVGHLEKVRNECYNTLRDCEWRIDKQSREFATFNDMRKAYRTELQKANESLVKMGLHHVMEGRPPTSPIFMPPTPKTSEEHQRLPPPPTELYMPPPPPELLIDPLMPVMERESRRPKNKGKKGGRNRSRCMEGGGGCGENLLHPSLIPNADAETEITADPPGRSKSRVKKKLKKKDSLPRAARLLEIDLQTTD